MEHKERLTKVKAEKRSPAPDNLVGPPRRKIRKPYIIECRLHPDKQEKWVGWMKDWHSWNGYATLDAANKAMDVLAVKYKNTYLFKISER